MHCALHKVINLTEGSIIFFFYRKEKGTDFILCLSCSKYYPDQLTKKKKMLQQNE